MQLGVAISVCVFVIFGTTACLEGGGGGGTAALVTAGDRCEAEGASADASDGCNTCVCDLGQWYCTRDECTGPGESCADGDVRMADDGCNVCVCDIGEWACTERSCGVEPDPEPGSGGTGGMGGTGGTSMEPVCTPFASQPADDGCNTCTCSSDGGSWACTEQACDPICVDGETRRAEDGCNVCTCGSGSWGCTKIGCSGEPVACGGFAGDTCTDDEYCAYAAGQYCGAADASAECEPRPNGCDADFTPVCGCDGKTHSNACMAAGSGTGVLSDGEC